MNSHHDHRHHPATPHPHHHHHHHHHGHGMHNSSPPPIAVSDLGGQGHHGMHHSMPVPSDLGGQGHHGMHHSSPAPSDLGGHGHHHGHGMHDLDPAPVGVSDLGGQGHHHDNHLHHSGGHGHAMGHHGMGHTQPVFRWVTTDVPVLFQHWTTSTILELTLAMLAAAALAAGYELLRNWLSSWDNTPRAVCTLPLWKRTCLRSFRSVLHALNAAVGYVQMLFAMTYDLRIFVAIILGSGLGFFVLGPYFRRITQRRKGKKSGRGCGKGVGAGGGGEPALCGGGGEEEDGEEGRKGDLEFQEVEGVTVCTLNVCRL